MGETVNGSLSGWSSAGLPVSCPVGASLSIYNIACENPSAILAYISSLIWFDLIMFSDD